MSQNRVSKRHSNAKTECCGSKHQIDEIQSVLNTLLSPILHEIAILNENVSSVLNLMNKKEIDSEKSLTKSCEFASCSIATDVTMMATSMHRLTKNYENIKDQIVEHQKNIDKFYTKLNSIEKLLGTLLKMENNRTMKQIEEQIFEKVSTLEQLLLGGLDVKPLNSTG